MIRSLRLRLLIHTSLAAAVILGLLGAGVYFFARRSLDSDFNQALLAKARAVAATAEQRGDKVVFDFAPDQFPQFVVAHHPDYFEGWIDPNIVIKSPSLGASDLPRPPAVGDIRYWNLTLPDGRPGRMVGMSFQTTIEPYAEGNTITSSSRTVVIGVATETTSLHRSLENLGWMLAGLCSLAIVASGIVLLIVVSRAVRPVERIARDIDQLRENDLSFRLRSAGVPLELEPVVEKLNGLLSRIEAAFAREKEFTANVAHELRTPLSALLTTFEVCRSRPRDELAYIDAIDRCREVSRRMQSMVEMLLMLSRAEAGQLSLKLKSTDAADLMDDCWALFGPRVDTRRLHVEWRVASPIVVETDSEKLRVILQNLFDNAVSYAEDGGSIRVVAEIRGEQLCITVANTGSRVDADQAPNLFNRFWRGDQARAGSGLHCGLGLSLCQRLVRLLNGQIEIKTTRNDWFTVSLTLPAARRPVQPANSDKIPADSAMDHSPA